MNLNQTKLRVYHGMTIKLRQNSKNRSVLELSKLYAPGYKQDIILMIYKELYNEL